VRALAGRIPRAFRTHKTPEGAAYGSYCRAKLARLGPLGKDAMPILRECGIVTIDLARVRADLEAARDKPNRRRQVRQLQRTSASLRGQLLALERRLEELANGHRTLAGRLNQLTGPRS